MLLTSAPGSINPAPYGHLIAKGINTEKNKEHMERYQKRFFKVANTFIHISQIMVVLRSVQTIVWAIINLSFFFLCTSKNPAIQLVN